MAAILYINTAQSKYYISGNATPINAIARQPMPIDRQRYPKDWQKIARNIKEAAGWRCQHCLRLCLRPGEKPPSLTRSEWTHATLSVHHSNFTPEDNTTENLIALCTPCHNRSAWSH